MSNKVCTLQEAVAKVCRRRRFDLLRWFYNQQKTDGSSPRDPSSRAKRFYCMGRFPAGSDWDMLIGEDRVKAYINCYTADSGVTNVSRRFRKKIEAGELIS